MFNRRALTLLDSPGLYGPYLKTLPTCPVAGRMTYTNYHPSAFSFPCCGNNHTDAYGWSNADSRNHPGYSSERGMLEPSLCAPKNTP
jgi:hypothetical protein